jgi:hypothetical protein
MSINPLITNSGPNASLYAPASGGGGGGGPNPAFSTITFPTAIATGSGPTAGGILFSQQLIFDDPATNIAGDIVFTAAAPYVGVAGATSTTSISVFAPANNSVLSIGAGQDQAIYIDGSAASGAPGVYWRGVGNVSISSMNISSINGAAPGGGGGVQSTIANAGSYINIPAGANPMNFNLVQGASFTTPGNSGSLLINGNILNNATVAASFSVGVNTPAIGTSSITVSTINGVAPGVTVSTFPGLIVSSPTSAVLTLNGGANQIVASSDNIAVAKLYATGASGLTISTVQSINGEVPMTMSTQPIGATTNTQFGYVQDCPNASTVLFTAPFPNDSVCVILTPTNRNTVGGANPNLSLNNGFGSLGRGVSSIGFQVDARNAGVGYNGSFFYMATSL